MKWRTGMLAYLYDILCILTSSVCDHKNLKADADYRVTVNTNFLKTVHIKPYGALALGTPLGLLGFAVSAAWRTSSNLAMEVANGSGGADEFFLTRAFGLRVPIVLVSNSGIVLCSGLGK